MLSKVFGPHSGGFLFSFFAVVPYLFFNGVILYGKVDPQLGFYVLSIVVVAMVLVMGLSYFLNEIKVKRFEGNLIGAFVRISGLIFFVFLYVGFSAKAFLEYSAYQDASNPETRPERLRELEGFEIPTGYEIDNLLAGNPSSPIDLLEALSKKEEHIGTLISLVSNENTPLEILNRIASMPSFIEARKREILIQSLKKNPRIVKGDFLLIHLPSGRVTIVSR
ncbi:DUF456 domain-containing protein [Alteromonas aestuariivivens]|uniref:DUF456 domain-containing protein n=1 Tax=Alteromonas aestuariivivens TaxID=1938339 RepID=A0A3D8MBY2_9ALTE|nr:DUF456 domain-containing protein [Alteromonas aestuariivivens]RDV27546.1 DUF456 domain-containing protein [Alteromonas aestuariivivens]